MWHETIGFEELKGKTIVNIKGEIGDDEMRFICSDQSEYVLYHESDCCESVTIEDIDGDLSDLIGHPILVAEESISDKNPKGCKFEYQDSFTWTYYKLDTIKGGVTIRWYGESNGYYSESVNFRKDK